jgi:transmembrane sensor
MQNFDLSEIEYFFRRYVSGTATETEREAFQEWMEHADSVSVLQQLVDDHMDTIEEPHRLDPETGKAIMKSILRADPPKNLIRPVRWWVAAAAAVLLLIGGGYYWSAMHQQPGLQVREEAPKVIQPATNKAILTLGNGERVVLDSNGARQIVQGGVTAQQAGGGLHYTVAAEVQYHTLSTSRGGLFNVELSDGTTVWLNAASSITYPTAFPGKERRVKITGEAYFDVAAKANQPFYVDLISGGHIEVLGTEFNVNAYNDEPEQRTTLLQGSIRYHAENNFYLLKPGQQALLKNGMVQVIEADVKKAIAWKNGYFHFTGASLEEMMRQLSRWYDVDVEYKGKIPTLSFGGKLGRDLTLNQVLVALQAYGINSKIVNGKLIIE